MATFAQSPLVNAPTNSLAGCYQEVLTTIIRLMSGADQVSDAARFRADIRQLLRTAEMQATRLRIDTRDIGLASYAVVAFVDTSIMTSRLPVFEDWQGQTLQAELYRANVGGETFFDNLTGIMRRPETTSTADLLDLYLNCMLLGFQGRLGTEQLNMSRPQIIEKLTRIRGESTELSPQWRPSRRRIVAPDDGRRLRMALNVLAAAAAGAVILYLVFRLLLDHGVTGFESAVSGSFLR
jgi:type VI secretion system protein ImpK